MLCGELGVFTQAVCTATDMPLTRDVNDTLLTLLRLDDLVVALVVAARLRRVALSTLPAPNRVH